MFDSAVKVRWRVHYGPAHPARVVVALRERKTGRIFRGESHEAHADLRQREGLGRSTEGWLDAGFVDLETNEFLTRGQAARRFSHEAGRTRGRGCADSSDFACIREAQRAGRIEQARQIVQAQQIPQAQQIRQDQGTLNPDPGEPSRNVPVTRGRRRVGPVEIQRTTGR